ncbi:hypothetical protein HELRODRAFT_188175 [Helobdella robusta]|uniref:Uncharacterized protein n=1 Tax=Helobdella robusta TaxID=6412 RepID=T1FPQ7_HELRO|nr:hypothetical protein HELRODRAFT_188175 [Helobdella robusta]ESO13233.1 hypothetical protein HELRODRAFT_188175 [Helobdella robusta]
MQTKDHQFSSMLGRRSSSFGFQIISVAIVLVVFVYGFFMYQKLSSQLLKSEKHIADLTSAKEDLSHDAQEKNSIISDLREKASIDQNRQLAEITELNNDKNHLQDTLEKERLQAKENMDEADKRMERMREEMSQLQSRLKQENENEVAQLKDEVANCRRKLDKMAKVQEQLDSLMKKNSSSVNESKPAVKEPEPPNMQIEQPGERLKGYNNRSVNDISLDNNINNINNRDDVINKDDVNNRDDVNKIGNADDKRSNREQVIPPVIKDKKSFDNMKNHFNRQRDNDEDNNNNNYDTNQRQQQQLQKERQDELSRIKFKRSIQKGHAAADGGAIQGSLGGPSQVEAPRGGHHVEGKQAAEDTGTLNNNNIIINNNNNNVNSNNNNNDNDDEAFKKPQEKLNGIEGQDGQKNNKEIGQKGPEGRNMAPNGEQNDAAVHRGDDVIAEKDVKNGDGEAARNDAEKVKRLDDHHHLDDDDDDGGGEVAGDGAVGGHGGGGWDNNGEDRLREGGRIDERVKVDRRNQAL